MMIVGGLGDFKSIFFDEWNGIEVCVVVIEFCDVDEVFGGEVDIGGEVRGESGGEVRDRGVDDGQRLFVGIRNQYV